MENDDKRTADKAAAIESETDEHAAFLEDTFGLSPETAKVTAEDVIAHRRRNPASDRVDDARAGAADSDAAEDVR